LLEEIDSLNVAGKSVLEIGYGMGSDSSQLARRGAILHGIDLTAGNLPITQKHLGMYGCSSELIIGDAEDLPYPNDTFDIVYTMGVIHHTPKMEKAVEEIYRVLKPGGKVWCAVYNKNSWFYYGSVLRKYYFSREYKTMTISERLSLVEYPNTNKNLLLRLTSNQELRKMFSMFSDIEIRHRGTGCPNLFKEYIPNWLYRKFESWWGWYNVVTGVKGR